MRILRSILIALLVLVSLAPTSVVASSTHPHLMSIRGPSPRSVASHYAQDYVPFLSYHGGPVVTAPPKVYLDFWGADWQNGFSFTYQGYTVTSAQVQDYVTKTYQGIGGSDWNNTTLQFCQGTILGQTADTCPSNAERIKNPGGSHLSGVWIDPSPVPNFGRGACSSFDSCDQLIQQEEHVAAQHFGGVSIANGGMVAVLTPFSPDLSKVPLGFAVQWCAYHNFSQWSEPYMVLPFIPQAFQSCGMDFVNPASENGYLDGYSITALHEYSEILTDPDVATGWYDDRTGLENADLCAWSPLSANITLGTGKFPAQPNDTEYGGIPIFPEFGGTAGCVMGTPDRSGQFTFTSTCTRTNVPNCSRTIPLRASGGPLEAYSWQWSWTLDYGGYHWQNGETPNGPAYSWQWRWEPGFATQHGLNPGPQFGSNPPNVLAMRMSCPALIYDPYCDQSWLVKWYPPGYVFHGVGYVTRNSQRWWYTNEGFPSQGWIAATSVDS